MALCIYGEKEKLDMKLEVGKFYRTRGGRKAEVVEWIDFSKKYIVESGGGGMWLVHWFGMQHDYRFSHLDLIAEWQDGTIRADEYGRAPSVETTRARILNTAKEAVTKDRNDTHGNPEDTFTDIAALWSAYLGEQLQPYDVCNMMALLKIARAKQNPKHDDNWIDIAGYAACGAEVGK